MFVIRFRNLVMVAAVGAMLVGAGCSPKDTATAGSGTGTTAPDPATLLGPTNPAKGSPITIGFVDDGKSAGIDETPIITAFNATVQYANEHLGGLNGHSITTRCATRRTVRMSCVTTRLVTRRSRCVCRINSLITSLITGSRPVVGSS